jgi:FAD/FMN-containing dehydrogenase
VPYRYDQIGAPRLDSGIHVVTPNSADYPTACQLSNRALSLKPAWIAYPYSDAEVVEAVRMARASDLPIAVRSGAHDYEGFSLNNDGAVIDTSRCDSVRVQGRSRCVVGAGVSLRKLYHALFSSGHGSLPGGTCGSVGVAGLTLGGGFGNLGRRHGLLCDRLRRVKIVTADGEIRECDDAKNSDLLWACRGGGGGNFGVVTEFEFEPVEVPAEVTSFSYKWPWSPTNIETLFRAYEAWIPGAPREIGATLVITSRSWNTLHFFGQSLLSPASTYDAIREIVSSLPNPTEQINTAVPFLHEMETYAGMDFTSSAWKMASSFSKNAISDEAVGAIIGSLAEAPPSTLIEFDALGGAVNDVAIDATAFPHRDQRLMWQYQAYWTDPNDAAKYRESIKGIFSAADPFTSQVSYRNYCDLNLDDWERRYYRSNYARLREIKAKFDPQNAFRYAQSVRPL